LRTDRFFKTINPVEIAKNQTDQFVYKINQSNNQLKNIEFLLDSIRIEMKNSCKPNQSENKK